jgi:hypothetical protein
MATSTKITSNKLNGDLRHDKYTAKMQEELEVRDFEEERRKKLNPITMLLSILN